MLTYSGCRAHRREPHEPSVIVGQGVFVVTWGLQTGSVISAIERERSDAEVLEKPRITYSMDGTMVAVLSRHHAGGPIISTFDVISGVHVHDIDCHQLCSSSLYHIWAHGESILFVTSEPTRINIWEVGFVPGATPMQVETLPGPDDVAHVIHFEFLPVSYRAVFIYSNRILVWDARGSQPLLHHVDINPHPPITFSADGRFFACSTTESGTYLWKESPTGYILHGKLSPYGKPLLSPTGKSLITFGGHMVRSWHMSSFPVTPSSTSVQPPQQPEIFVLDFLPRMSLAAVARQNDNEVIAIDLMSGVPRWTINTPMAVYGLRVIGNTVAVIGDRKAVTWKLLGGNILPDTRIGAEDSTQIINFGNGDNNAVLAASISTDFQYVVLAKHDVEEEEEFLDVYCTSTGRNLRVNVWALALWFPPGGHDISCVVADTEAYVFKVTRDALYRTESVVDIENGSLGCPWGSSRGYKVTSDGWILGLDGKRLLMLPPPWRSGASRRVWNGQFLALLHAALPEPVIIEFEL